MDVAAGTTADAMQDETLGSYPGMRLWDHLRQHLPPDAAAEVYETAADAVRRDRA